MPSSCHDVEVLCDDLRILLRQLAEQNGANLLDEGAAVSLDLLPDPKTNKSAVWLTAWQARTFVAFRRIDLIESWPPISLLASAHLPHDWFNDKWGFHPGYEPDAERDWPILKLSQALRRPIQDVREELRVDFMTLIGARKDHRRALEDAADNIQRAGQEGHITAYKPGNIPFTPLEWKDAPRHEWRGLFFRQAELRAIISPCRSSKPSQMTAAEVATPPDGFIFIDWAIDKLKGQHGLSDGPAWKRLLDVMHLGEVWTWERKGGDARAKIRPSNWMGADVNLEVFRLRGNSGIFFCGSYYHLHHFLISADDFDCWLKQAPAPQGFLEEVAKAPVETIPRADAVSPEPIRKRGRQPARYWNRIHALVRQRLKLDGIPEAGDGGQTAMENMVKAELAKLDNHPAESTIRDHVKKVIESYREELG